MNHLQTQYIRFPTITRLLYDGDEQKPKDNFKSTRTKLTNTRPILSSSSDPDSFKVVMLPNQHQIINICTLSLPKRQSRRVEEQQTDEKNNKKKYLFQKKSSVSMTGINFSIKRKPSQKFLYGTLNPLDKKINFNEMYSQVMSLIALCHGIVVQKPLISRIRRAKVDKGNNGYLVKQTIKKRSWWNTTNDDGLNINLLWTENLQRKNIPKEDCSEFIQGQESKVIFQRNFEVALKSYDKMVQLFFTEWEQKPQKLGSWLYSLKASAKLIPQNLLILNKLPAHSEITNKKMLHVNLTQFYCSKDLNPNDYTPKTYHITSFNWQYKVKEIKQTEEVSKEKAWLLKPGEFTNQGRGIMVFKNIQQAMDYLMRHPPKGEERSMILQAYIRPILYEGRKFDIRCFMLGVQVLDSLYFYWYDEGYIRTASDKFTLKNTSKSIHLTNDAVQKSLDNYDKYESANKLSYSDLEKYLHNHMGVQFYKNVVPSMKKIARDTCQAASKIGGPTNSVYFQLFGLDFILDEKGRPFLLQVNTNPSLEVASNLLSRIIPEVIDNSLRLVIDVLLPSHKGAPDWAQQFVLNNKYSLLYRRNISGKQKQETD